MRGKLAAALILCCAVVALCGCGPKNSGASDLVLTLDDTNFDDEIAEGVVLVDFWAPWCGPCRQQGPIVEDVAGQVGDNAKVAKLNVDDAPEAAQRFGVRSIPTIIIFTDGEPGKRFVGVTSADALVSAIEDAQ